VELVAGVSLTGWASALGAALGQAAAGAGGFTVIDAHCLLGATMSTGAAKKTTVRLDLVGKMLLPPVMYDRKGQSLSETNTGRGG
jgi:hypothetical protein